MIAKGGMMMLGASVALLAACGDRAVVREDQIIQRLGAPDEIMYGISDGEAEPSMFLNKQIFPDRWKIYNYHLDGWIIGVVTKDERVVRISSYNKKEAEERARAGESDVRKRLSP